MVGVSTATSARLQTNSVIRYMSPAGVLSTVAGTPSVASFSGDGGAATSATINNPSLGGPTDNGGWYISDTCGGVLGMWMRRWRVHTRPPLPSLLQRKLRRAAANPRDRDANRQQQRDTIAQCDTHTDGIEREHPQRQWHAYGDADSLGDSLYHGDDDRHAVLDNQLRLNIHAVRHALADAVTFAGADTVRLGQSDAFAGIDEYPDSDAERDLECLAGGLSQPE